MALGKTWTAVFRCYHCGGKFTIRHNPLDRIDALQAVYPCPFCSARPIVRIAPDESRGHRLVELNDEMETVYRKNPRGDTWHFHPACSHWPAQDYIALDMAPRTEHLCNECTVKALGRRGN
ncbi:MAG TPA: hypothetical protein VL754_18990 [Verrucomicrobiae bacterium]|nr:hypothetical protein [Verrucomicrobiae bacterium]